MKVSRTTIGVALIAILAGSVAADVGSVTNSTAPVITTQTDGTVVRTYANGDVSYTSPDGSVRFESIKGYTHISYPNGSDLTTTADGVTYQRDVNGDLLINRLDGSWSLVETNGTRTHRYASGRTVIFNVSGTKTTTEVNGSVVVEQPNGDRISLGVAGTSLLAAGQPTIATSDMAGPATPADTSTNTSTTDTTQSPDVTLKMLSSGSGFASSTPAIFLSAIGDPSTPGYDAQAIARWDVVPFQQITGPFAIGVVAFHINGIQRVDFRLNGGPAVSVTEMSLNTRTNVWEYQVVLDPTQYPDGKLEVRAEVYPLGAGIPRVLGGPIDGELNYLNGNNSMILYADSGGTLRSRELWCSPTGNDSTGDGTQGNPFASPARAMGWLQAQEGSVDGMTINLMAGTYTWGPAPTPYPMSNERWITMQPAPGVAKADVIFDKSGSGGFRTQRVHAKGLTFSGSLMIITIGETIDDYLWIDDCDMIGPGKLATNSQFFQGVHWDAVYITGSAASDNMQGLRDADFIRGTTIRNISSDAFGDTPFVVNSSVDGVDATGTLAHPDIFQHFAHGPDRENYIMYNVTAINSRAQGFIIEDFNGNDTINNVAFVNVLLAKGTDDELRSHWKKNANHLLFWNFSMPDQYLRVHPGYTFKNVSIQGSIFKAIIQNPFPADTRAEYVHYVSPNTYGAFLPGYDPAFDGNPGFVADGSDYRLSSSAPGYKVIPKDRQKVPADAKGRVLGLFADFGPLQN